MALEAVGRVEDVGLDAGAGEDRPGIVQDDLHALERFQITAPRDPSRVFYVDYNPARARRHQGAGRAEAPPGWARVHGGCYLCPENILWHIFVKPEVPTVAEELAPEVVAARERLHQLAATMLP